MGSPRTFDYLILLVGILAVSTGAVIIRETEAPTGSISAYRLTVASMAMLAFTLWKRHSVMPATASQTVWVLTAGFCLSFHFLFWVESVKQTSIATSVVLVSTAPLFVAIASGPILGERPSAKVWLGLAIAAAGTVVMVADDLGSGSDTLRGDAYALLGAVLAAGFLLVGRRVLRDGGSWLPYSSATYLVAALVLVVALGVSGDPAFGFSTRTYTLLVLLALLPQVIGHTALNRSLGLLPAVVVALAVQAEPVGSTILAVTLLNEAPTALELIGGVIVLAGVYFGLRAEGSTRSREPSPA